MRNVTGGGSPAERGVKVVKNTFLLARRKRENIVGIGFRSFRLQRPSLSGQGQHPAAPGCSCLDRVRTVICLQRLPVFSFSVFSLPGGAGFADYRRWQFFLAVFQWFVFQQCKSRPIAAPGYHAIKINDLFCSQPVLEIAALFSAALFIQLISDFGYLFPQSIDHDKPPLFSKTGKKSARKDLA